MIIVCHALWAYWASSFIGQFLAENNLPCPVLHIYKKWFIFHSGTLLWSTGSLFSGSASQTSSMCPSLSQSLLRLSWPSACGTPWENTFTAPSTSATGGLRFTSIQHTQVTFKQFLRTLCHKTNYNIHGSSIPLEEPSFQHGAFFLNVHQPALKLPQNAEEFVYLLPVSFFSNLWAYNSSHLSSVRATPWHDWWNQRVQKQKNSNWLIFCHYIWP